MDSLELAAVRESLQTRLLVELMSNAMSKELVLKGGMAMRAVHGSVRYTKDIDLDADLKFSRAHVRGIVRRSIERALAARLIEEACVTEPKQTETTMGWKIVGVQPGSRAPVHLTVEVSRRAALLEGRVVEVPLSPEHRAAPGVKVRVLDSQALAVTKVLALTDPRRTAPRDLYDLHVLMQARVDEPGALLATLPNAKQRVPQALAELWPKIESMTFDQFRSEVAPYLPLHVAHAIDETAFDDMRVNVGTHVENWLRAASAHTPIVDPSPAAERKLVGGKTPTTQPARRSARRS